MRVSASYSDAGCISFGILQEKLVSKGEKCPCGGWGEGWIHTTRVTRCVCNCRLRRRILCRPRMQKFHLFLKIRGQIPKKQTAMFSTRIAPEYSEQCFGGQAQSVIAAKC